MTFIKSVALALVVGLSASVADVASAATVSVSKQTSSIFGDEQYFKTAKYTESTSGDKFGPPAGAFQLQTSDWKGLNNPLKFMAFCLTPFASINLAGHPDYMVGSALSETVQNMLGALAHGAWTKIVDATSAAAFQLAAWEIATDGDSALDLSNGVFSLRSGNDVTMVQTAKDWLAAIAAKDPMFDKGTAGLTFLSVPTQNGQHVTQDLMTYNPPAPVPLPAAFGLLAAGLAAFAALGRARRT